MVSGMKAKLCQYKNGDLSDTKKWCGITLMDIGAKRFSSILCKRAFNTIKEHGVKDQFGCTIGVVFQYGSFTLNNLLHLQHNHNLPSWVAFKDLLKSFNTYGQNILIAILARYEVPPHFFYAIRRIYNNSVARLIIEN